MSLSKVDPFEDNYRRDSFSDRVCDDLSEVILQFLSIEDKFRLECVSKQFERTVFERTYELVIDELLTNAKRRDCFEIILQKLRKIRSIKQKHFRNHFVVKDSEISLINIFCNHLTQIHCNLSLMSETNRNVFMEKFGSKLVSFSATRLDLQMIDKSFDNLQEIRCSTRNTSSVSLSDFSEVLIKKLKKLSIRFIDFNRTFEEAVNGLKTFIQNHKYLTHLTINFNKLDENQLEIVFKELSHFNSLISFEIQDSIEINLLTNGLKQMTRNFHKLKKLGVKCYHNNYPDMQLMSIIKQFKQIKSLEICFFINFNLDQFEITWNKEMVTGFESLTHLKLYFRNNNPIDSTVFLKDFDKCLPKLQSLYLRTNLSFVANQQTIDILSGLTKLESIEMKVKNNSYLFENDIKKRCKKIKKLIISSFDNGVDIGSKTT